MSVIVIVESPSKIKKISEILGNNYTVIASFGHITGISKLDNINTDTFEVSYDILDDKKSVFNNIKKMVKSSRELIIATDADSEGEAIGFHICDKLNLPISTTKRILFNEITEKAILNAIQNPTILNMDLIESQKTRQIIDMIVGYTVTPMLWKHLQTNNSKKSNIILSSGRCQTPALRLIYDRYLEIQNNNAIKYYKTTGYFSNLNIPFILDHDFLDEMEIEYFLTNEIKGNNTFINEIKHSSRIDNPPVPLITSKLQQIANAELGLSTKETMKYAQELYEKSLITYMRTDTKKYSADFIQSALNYAYDKYPNSYVPENNYISNIINNSNDGNPHEGIRPTNILINYNDLDEEKYSKKAIRLYKLIWKISIQSCLHYAEYTTITVLINVGNYIFKNTSEKIKIIGWKALDLNEHKSKSYDYLNTLKEGNIITYNSIIAELHIKNLKQHYSEGGIVKALEEIGIGRPSTYSSLVQKLIDRKYVIKENISGIKIIGNEFILENGNIIYKSVEKNIGEEKGKLVITSLGILVIQFLLENYEDLFNYTFTSTMEGFLDEIITKKSKRINICREYYDKVTELTKLLKTGKLGIDIDDNNTFIVGRNGPVIKSKNEEGKVIFKSIKQNIDINKIKNGDIELDDILEKPENNCILLGKTKLGIDIYIKKGIYGLYFQWGENKKSLKTNRPITNISFDEAIDIIENNNSNNDNNNNNSNNDNSNNDDNDNNNNEFRKIDNNLSIRKNKKTGEYYVFFKNKYMKTPKFFSLSGFNDDNYMTCDLKILRKWLNINYKI